jgi:transcriptional regulator with XRE-family HTH domain
MQKPNTLRAHFGLTQQELADLLGVSRSQIALHETGRRTLSGAALLRFAEMLQHMQSHQEKPAPTNKAQLDKHRDHIAGQLKDVTFKQARLDKENAAAHKKTEAASRRAHFADFKPSTAEDAHLQYIRALAQSGKTRHAADHFKHDLARELKQALLDAEKNFLEAKLKTLSK